MNRQVKFYVKTGAMFACALVTLSMTGSWWLTGAACVCVWILLAIASVIFSSREPDQLANLYDNYLVETDLVDNARLKSDYLEIDGKSHFVSYRPQQDGLFVLHSSKRYGLIPWQRIFMVQELVERKLVRVVLCPSEAYNGPRDLLLPWDCQFTKFVPGGLLDQSSAA